VRRVSLGEGLDLVVGVIRLVGGDIAEGNGLADRVSPAGRGGDAQDLAVPPDGLERRTARNDANSVLITSLQANCSSRVANPGTPSAA